MTWPEIVASNALSLPVLFVSFSVINASTFVFESAVLLSNRTPSLKVIVMLPELENDEVPFEGLKVTVGAVVSLLKNVEVGVVPNPESPE